MQSIDFYELPRTAQERFVGSIKGTGLPTPIVRAHARPVEPRLWAGLSALSFVCLVALLALGFGNLESSLGHDGLGLLGADVILVASTLFGILRALALRREHRNSPFPRGVYVFPVGLVDARTELLGVYPIEDLQGVLGPDGRGLTLDFRGKTFSFPVESGADVASLKAELERAGSAMSAAGGARESIRPKALAALDPLQGYANPLSSNQQMSRSRVSWARFAWLIASMAGLALGVSLWAGRNALSDDAMFARARAAGDTATYRTYLQRGTRHADEVAADLLPRAELRDAEAVGTVDAMEAFIQSHPQPQIANAAALARRSALLRELDGAAKAGSLAPLDAFAARHPHAGVDAELAAARHRVYQDAFERYRATASDHSGAMFVAKLLAWSEKHGPDVELRYRIRRSKTMEKADRSAGQSRQFKGIISLPSRYFDDHAEKADFDALLGEVSSRFGEVFPKEIVSFKVGAPFVDADEPLPARIAAPTLFVEQTSTWAGAIQASLKPRGVFIGVELTLDGTFRIPDEASSVKVRGDGWYVPGLAAATESSTPEVTIYASIRTTAFEQFERRVLATFFARPK